MKKFCWLWVFFLGFFVLTLAQAQTAPASKRVAILIDIKGAIGPAVQDYVNRGIETAEQKKAAVVILRIDTPGGLSQSMRGIIKAMLNSPVPVISYVSPSGARAASAGTYILYASQIAAMAPGTNLGAATPVSIGSPAAGKKAEGKPAKMAKAINDAKAYIRSLAQLHGRNVEWAEQAVSQAASLSAQEALAKNVINIIAKDIPQLLSQANGKQVLVRGQKMTLDTTNLHIQAIHPDWRARFLAVITNPSVAYILLMIGFYGLFFEFAHPGFIIPGVSGAICLLLALYAFQLLPVSYAGLGLIIFGMILIISEAFVPSFGALGIGGIIAFIIGSIMLMKTGHPGFALPAKLIVGATVATGLVGFGIIFMMYRSRRRPVVSGVEGMVGLPGVVVESDGKLWVRVQGELWRVANSEHLQVGDAVTVKRIEGLTVIVDSTNQ